MKKSFIILFLSYPFFLFYRFCNGNRAENKRQGDNRGLSTIRGDINELRTSIRGEINELRASLRGEISELRTEIKDWMTGRRLLKNGLVSGLTSFNGC